MKNIKTILLLFFVMIMLGQQQEIDICEEESKKEYTYSNYQDRHWMEEGAKWYREQIKKQK